MREAARRGALLLCAVLWASPLAAQDQSQVADLAQLLSLEDRREFDASALRRAAQHPDALVRAQAAVAIGRIGDRAGTPMLVTLLSDPDTTVRAEAAFAIGLLTDRSAVEELTRRLDALPAVAGGADQLEIVTALARIGGQAVGAAFEALLQRHPARGSEDDAATSQALLESWRLRRRAPVDRLITYVRDATGTWRRNATYSVARLAALGALTEPGPAATALLEAATDSDQLTRAFAARALTAQLADSSRVGRDAFVGRLRMMVADGDPQVRITALRSLATFRDSSLAGLALSCLVDRDPNAVVQALATLGALGGSGAADALEERFNNGTTYAVRRGALLGLAEAAPQRALAAGEKWRSDPDWRLRASFADALGSIPGGPSRTVLVDLSADADPRVAEAALASLGATVPRGDAALRALARLRLASADVMVRAAAIELLDRERDPALLPDLIAAYRRAERDEASDARLATLRAFQDIADLDAAQASRVETEFLGTVSRSGDFLVRRAVADRFGAEVERQYWGGVTPIETGRSTEDYRDVARSLWLPALQGGPLPQVTIETDRGNITLILYAADAPLTVQNFLRLVDRRYFDGSRWHRVVPNFVIQDGDPRGDGNGGPGWVIRDEINRRRYDRGAVGMALSGPDTGGSQFFICHSPQPHLDGGYTVFGHVTQGDAVLDQIVQGDRIRRIIR